MLVAVHFPAGADRCCPTLPFLPGCGIVWHRAESRDRPRRHDLGDVLAEALLAAIHHDRDLTQVGAAARVGHAGDPLGPGLLGLGEQGVDLRADPGVQDGRDVAGSGQVAGGDGGADYLSGVQPR
jgi:hypothetical protein